MRDKPLQVRHRTRKAKPGSVSAPIASSAGHDPHRPVGYGNPPRASQFQKGQSGNPRGRPRLKKNLGTLIDEVLFKEVVITEGGRRRKVSAAKALFMRQLSEGLSGDGKAFERLFRAYQRLNGSAAEEVAGAATEQTEAEKAIAAELRGWLEAGEVGKGEAGDD